MAKFNSESNLALETLRSGQEASITSESSATLALCRIDKDSSAELSRAVSSILQWYVQVQSMLHNADPLGRRLSIS